MSQLLLPGLLGSQPIGALAAFGLLRVATGLSSLGRVALGWEWEGDPKAVLATETDCSAEDLIDRLLEHLRGRDRFPTFRGRAPGAGSDDPTDEEWSDLKVPPPDFARLLEATRNAGCGSAREPADFLAAFGSEVVRARSTGDVKPTAFRMTAGQQQFLKSIRELAASLDAVAGATGKKAEQRRQEVRRAFREALFGEWQYQDDLHSLGWDPHTEALHALSAIAPTAAGPKSVRAAVWLAVEALPLFPCFPVAGRLHTRGFDPRADEFRWPIWRQPITLAALRSLLCLPDLYEEWLRPESLHYRGIECVYASARPTDANGRGIFRPAVLVPLARE